MKTFNTAGDAKDYSRNNPRETVEYKTYHEDGQLWEHFFYVNGLVHGEYKTYHDNGQLWEHYFIVDGELNGESKTYWMNGQLREHCFYVDGELLDVEHLKDGSYKSLCILSTIFNGNVIDEDI